MAESFDAVIIGAGVIGAAVASALIEKHPRWKIAVLEKEPAPALHTSGRNSGVVHSGFNQKPGTLKAKFCVEGSRRMREFCEANKVPCRTVGTLVVAAAPSETPILEEILKRGRANGVEGLNIIDGKKIRELEPNALGHAALHSPTGAIADSVGVVTALTRRAQENGVAFLFNQRVRAIEQTAQGYKVEVMSPSPPTLPSRERVNLRAQYSALITEYLFNCAGLQADRIAHFLGAGSGFSIVPFRGEYYKIRPELNRIISSMVYPVPNLKYPFLGVHWTKKIDGGVAVGPNAILALGRESYRMQDIHWADCMAMAADPAVWRMLAKKEFIGLAAHQFILSISRTAVHLEASRLVEGSRPEDFFRAVAGNRAQLVDRRGNLIDDIVVERLGNSIHVLNAVSPGFTSSLAFADHLVDIIK